MFRTRFFSLLGLMGCLIALSGGAAAAEVEAGSVYCFSAQDFSPEAPVTGICITDLSREGSFCLGSRVLKPGDVLTAEQVAQMTFCPLPTEADAAAQVGYLPIYDGHAAEPAAMTIGIRGKTDQPPVAEDSAVETYKNLVGTGRLKVSDPEGQPMTFAVTRQPRRGAVTIAPDGSFTYTPKKNKVGIDSFTFTATDPAGKTSREATVTVTILKPSDTAQYTDTAGRDCRFAAEWMRHTGIFAGERVAGNPCFAPDTPVTRGEFVTMLVKALDIPADEDLVYTGYTDQLPGWLQPYLAAAMRSGLTAGLEDTEVFGPDKPITGEEAAVMIQNALDLEGQPLDAQGIVLDPKQILTRDKTATVLYQAARLNGYVPEIL